MKTIKRIRNSFIVKKLLPSLKNRYALTIIGFLVWISFFDRNDLISQHAYKSQLKKLDAEKKYYEQEIAGSRHDLNELVSSNRNLEKFARERYLMKKEEEDIFVIVTQPAPKTEDPSVN